MYFDILISLIAADKKNKTYFKNLKKFLHNTIIADHVVYYRNNRLIHQFSLDRISINDFCELEGKAVYDTPGLVLMAHIINNIGVAYLFEHFIENAIEEFIRENRLF